jgi:hypothetical protein
MTLIGYTMICEQRSSTDPELRATLIEQLAAFSVGVFAWMTRCSSSMSLLEACLCSGTSGDPSGWTLYAAGDRA